MHYVESLDSSFAGKPAAPTENSSGIARRVLVGAARGATHTELAIGSLEPGGWLGRHLHSFEEGLYVLGGELILELDGHVHLLRAGDYALMPVGIWHTLANGGDVQVRWLAVNTPQRLAPDAPRKDTFFAGLRTDVASLRSAAQSPELWRPSTRLVGHYEGTPPQLEALAVKDPARGRKPAGMDTAVLAYSGISVKMLMDRNFGAELLTMFTVDYETGGAAQAHDHPFEECYFFLAGEIEAELDGKEYHLRAGDAVFAGVGSVHGFYNVGKERVRWIETQAPQPPARHSYRWVAPWKRLEEMEPQAVAAGARGSRK